MKLLIITQTLDKTDPILGFFVKWVEEFAKHCEHVHVLALNVGVHDLSENVTVHSLGKREGKRKLTQLARLWRASWTLRHQYNGVFVHMNPEYILYGGLLWRLLKKRIGFWYTHGTVSLKLRLATHLVHHVFTASPESFRLDTKKKIVTGHGIDTELFSPASAPEKDDDTLRLIAVGRLSRTKRIDFLLHVLAELHGEQKTALTVVGVPITADDRHYLTELKTFIEEQDLSSVVTFTGAQTQEGTRDLLRTHDVFVHASETGSLDKVVLEALATGIPVVTTSPACKDLNVSFVGDKENVYAFAQMAAGLKGMKKESTISDEMQEHSLPSLAQRITSYYE